MAKDREERRRRRRGRRRAEQDRVRHIRLLGAILILLVVLVVTILVMDRKKKPEAQETNRTEQTQQEEVIEISGDQPEEETESGAQETTEEIQPDNNLYTTDFSQYELQKDNVPQINQLISSYFQAKVDQDAQALYALFGKSGEQDLEARSRELKNEAVYIEDYQDITCYTKPGLTEDAYVVYVTYDVKFRRVDTLAPGLMWCYAAKDDSGEYRIRENVVGEEADYVAKQNQTEDVRLLSLQVNERLKQAIESDVLLAGIYQDLRNGAVVNSSEEAGSDSEVQLIEEGAQNEAPAEGGSEAASGENSSEEGQTESQTVNEENSQTETTAQQ